MKKERITYIMESAGFMSKNILFDAQEKFLYKVYNEGNGWVMGVFEGIFLGVRLKF